MFDVLRDASGRGGVRRARAGLVLLIALAMGAAPAFTAGVEFEQVQKLTASDAAVDSEFGVPLRARRRRCE